MINPSQALQFAGKSVLVTGGGSGIGAAVAQSFGAAGARVAVHYSRNREGAEAVASVIRQAGGQAITLAGNLLDRSVPDELVAQTVEAFGGLDILINNAGDMFGRRPLEQASDEDFDRVIGLNIHAAFALCRACAPVMRQAGRGSMINTTSIAARNGGAEGAGLYGSAKAFVSTMTRARARDGAARRARQRRGAGRHPDRLPRTQLHAGAARRCAPQYPDGPPGNSGRMRGALPVPGRRCAFELHHRPDH